MSFEVVCKFEKLIADFFEAPYAIATDSCTHAIELSLRYSNITSRVAIPTRTYISLPFIMQKLNITWNWKDERWKNFYKIDGTNIYDAAVLWQRGSYIKDTFMCISFQFQKHLSIGRGGMILTDSKDAYETLMKMSYDGRIRDLPWREQNISSFGFHYYMPPESAQIGIEKFEIAVKKEPIIWTSEDYPNLRKMNVFRS